MTNVMKPRTEPITIPAPTRTNATMELEDMITSLKGMKGYLLLSNRIKKMQESL